MLVSLPFVVVSVVGLVNGRCFLLSIKPSATDCDFSVAVFGGGGWFCSGFLL